jgi:O-antigen ligase
MGLSLASELHEAVEAPEPNKLRARVDPICERAILGVVLFILVWSPLALGAAPALEFAVVEGLTALAVALWGVRFWSQRPFRLFWPPICWAVLAFLCYALVRCPLVPVPYPAHREMMEVIVYATLFFVIVHNLNRRESAAVVSLTLIGVGFVIALLALLQFSIHPATIWGMARPEQYIRRGSGTFINPNNMAGFLAMLVPLALGYVVMGRLSATVKVLLGYAVLVMMAGIAMSLSRGGMLATAAALAVFFLVLSIQRDFWLSALVTLATVLMVGLVLGTQITSLQRRFDLAFQGDKVDDQRFLYWQGAWKLFAHDRMWGVGPSHFDIEFPSVRPSEVQSRPEFTHNDYLNTLCEWGVAGMALIVAACGLLYAGAFQTWRAVRKGTNELGSARSDKTAFVVGASVGLLGVMLHCIVDFNLHIPADAITAVALMALLTAQGRFATERFWKNPGKRGKIVFIFLAALTAAYLAAEGIHSGAEAWWLREAGRETASWDRLLADLEKAHQIEPGNFQTDYTLGEYWRTLSQQGNPGWEKQARQALQWYGEAARTNPFDGYSPMRCGMCLDWLDQPEKAAAYFKQAEEKDPNNAYLAMQVGRHFMVMGDVAAARRWFDRSLALFWNQDAYWQEVLLDRRMKDVFPPGLK